MNSRLDEESVAARFRQWLDETRAEADSLDGEDLSTPEQGEDAPPVGLYRLVEEFTALRHELKLQTKSSRNLAERNEATRAAVEAMVEAFHAGKAGESEAADRAAKPLVESLIDLDEALRRGRAVIETARRRILEELTGRLQDQWDDLRRSQPFWRRWIGRRWHEKAREILLQRAALGHREIFDSLLEGYGLMLRRLDRAMKQAGIYRIECVGKTADPNTMTIIEALDDPLRPPGLVVEEIRPGYYWKGNVFRFAEVRAIQA